MKIGIDIDNVVVKLTEGFCNYYNLKNLEKLDFENLKGYYLCDSLPITREEEHSLWHEYHDSDNFDDIGFVGNAKEVINLLKLNHKLFFITARHPGWEEKTRRFFSKHFPEDHFNIIFSGEVYGGAMSKDEICNNRGIKLIIEDHNEKGLDYAKRGIQVLLLSMPWNKNCEEHEKLTRVKDWNEILEKIEEFEQGEKTERGEVKNG